MNWDEPNGPSELAALAEAERLDAIFADIERAARDERDRNERESGHVELRCPGCQLPIRDDESSVEDWDGREWHPDCTGEDETGDLRRAGLDHRGRP
jgi:hypothetical protein